jgi:predicted small secreted protein
MLRDLRDSLRIFTRQPGFAAVIVLTLALGIGATTAIFSLIYGILLRPFPFRESDRLVRVQSTFTNTGAIERWWISGRTRAHSIPTSVATVRRSPLS